MLIFNLTLCIYIYIYISIYNRDTIDLRLTMYKKVMFKLIRDKGYYVDHLFKKKYTYGRLDFIINSVIVCNGNRQHNSLGSFMIYFSLQFYDNFPYQ